MKFFWMLGIFAAGFVTAINLTDLIDTNPDYVASWWKVGAGIIGAIFLAFLVNGDL